MKEVSEARTISESSNSVKILKGIAISAIITLVLLFIYAIILTFTNLGENTIGPVIIGITGISILIRKFNDNKLNKKKWNTKRWNNRSGLYIIYILCFKYNTEVALA